MRVSSVATMTSLKRFGLLALLDDVLDERLARDERQRLAGKPRRSVTRGNDADDFHGAILSHSLPRRSKPRRQKRRFGMTIKRSYLPNNVQRANSGLLNWHYLTLN